MGKKRPGRPRKTEEEKLRDQSRSLNVKIQKDLKDFLSEIKGEGTEKQAIEWILAAWKEFSPDQRRAILRNPKLFSSWATLLFQNNWASHCFELRHWSWAIKCYERLLKQQTDSDYESFCLYRQGYAWIGYGVDDLRKEAIRLGPRFGKSKDGKQNPYWSDLFEAAIECFKKGIEKSAQAEKLTQALPFVSYNMACAHSLWAQAEVERVIDTSDKIGADFYRRLSNESTTEAWNYIGSKWRKSLKGVNTIEVDYHAGTAFQLLAKSVNSNQQVDGEFDKILPHPDPEFLLHSARTDSDLVFLRFDSLFKDRFSETCSDANHAKKVLENFGELIHKY